MESLSDYSSLRSARDRIALLRRTTAQRLQPKHPALNPLYVLALFSLVIITIRYSFLNPNQSLLFPARVPRPVLLTVTHGDVGNQINLLLEALMLTHQTNLVFVPPSVPVRHISKQTQNEWEHRPEHIWNLPYMNRFTRIAVKLPSSCKSGPTHIYLVRSGGGGHLMISRRARMIACEIAGGVSKYETKDQCAERALTAASIQKRFLNFTSTGDDSLIRELAKMTGGCVLLDGHSFSRSGKLGHEFLNSVLHYVEPARSLKKMAHRWWKPKMTVLHLEYDERQCVPHVDIVCIKRTQTYSDVDSVFYVPYNLLVNIIVKLMHASNSRVIYIAGGPYAPLTVISALEKEFKSRVVVAPRVRGVDPTMQNLLERELAIMSDVLVGDFGSTWSGTAYFKRRTVGKGTEWSCILLDECHELGYFQPHEQLRTPEYFEEEYGLKSSIR